MSGLWLNCGSGQRPFQKPWLNVDVQERWNPDVVLDLKQPWHFEDASADLVVFHHVWEHEGCQEARGMQEEAWRVLRPGGSLLVFVPNMRALAQAWLLGKLDTETYLINIYGAYMGNEHDRHRFGYTRETLERELKACPWTQVKPFDWRWIEGMDVARDWWVLAMEAVK